MKTLFVLLCLVLLLVPVTAQDVSFTAPPNYCIWSVNMDMPIGTTGTITFTQANGDITTATFSYVDYPLTHASASIGSDSETFTYTQPVVALPFHIKVWNGENTSDYRVLKLGFGQTLPLAGTPVWNKVIQTEVDRAVISSYHLSADHQVTIHQELIPTYEANQKLMPRDKIEWWQLLTEYLPMLWGVFLSLMYWLKYLFVDHLLTTILLYSLGSLAYAANTCRDIFKVYKTWFRQQKDMFEFISNGFSTTISIITQVLNVVGSILSSILGKLVP